MLGAMAIRSPKWLVLWDDDELLHIGATRGSLRKELVHALLERESRATRFSWEISFDPAARERELLAELAHARKARSQ